jgi:hypothetical protein
VDLDGLAVTIQKTLFKTGPEALTIMNSFGVAIPGGATLVDVSAFSPLVVTNGWTTSGVTYRDAGLWQFTVDTGANGGIDAAMTNLKDTVAYPKRGTQFAAEDAGYVKLTGLAADQEISLKIDLANVVDISAVVARLNENPLFSKVEAVGGNAVRLRVIPSWAGDGYFPWDNSATAVHPLGADVIKVAPVLPPGTVLVVR